MPTPTRSAPALGVQPRAQRWPSSSPRRARWVAPMQNMVVADRDGRIGFVAPAACRCASAEQRPQGPGAGARLGRALRLGRLRSTPTQTPRELDPPRGWIATANQRIHGADYPHFLTSEWALPYRQQRIEQLLRPSRKHRPRRACAAMQADVKSLAAARLLPWLRKAQSGASAGRPRRSAQLRRLRRHDGRRPRRAADLLGLGAPAHAAACSPTSSAPRCTSARSARAASATRWKACSSATTPGGATTRRRRRPRPARSRSTPPSTRALDELQAAHGADVSTWQWGDAHQARSEHRPFSRVKRAGALVRAAHAGGRRHLHGQRRRVCCCKPDPTTGELYLDEHGPSLRALYDLGRPEALALHAFERAVGPAVVDAVLDFVQDWTRVEYVPLWSAEPPLATLTMSPAN